ncbi:MAG: alanine racemase [Clostridia bacterium]|nr:alanine racemase [Clostridia bacterium]
MAEIFDTLRTWAEVDLDALMHNFSAARNHLPKETKLLAVIKSDAYGHGAVRIARLLEGKADYFAVAMTDEAVELRNAGIETPILLLGLCQPSEYPRIIKHGLTAAVSSVEGAEALSQCALKSGKTAKIHIALDTGMSRIGFPCEEKTVEAVKYISELPGIYLEGIFSHFAKADAYDKAYAEYQLERFESITGSLEKIGVNIPIRHLYNSAALVDMPARFDMVREGIILYGMHPSAETELSKIGGIKGVMSLRTHVVHVKTLPAGVSVSYGCTYTTERETVVATLSAGYADGVPRLLSNKGKVIIGGKIAPIIGRVCMDQFMVDVTHVPDVKAGDTATVFGRDGELEITADDVAESIGTIGYELTCDINRRVPRVYIKDGKIDSIKRILPDD